VIQQLLLLLRALLLLLPSMPLVLLAAAVGFGCGGCSCSGGCYCCGCGCWFVLYMRVGQQDGRRPRPAAAAATSAYNSSVGRAGITTVRRRLDQKGGVQLVYTIGVALLPDCPAEIISNQEQHVRFTDALVLLPVPINVYSQMS
jgi:hypothetical protein